MLHLFGVIGNLEAVEGRLLFLFLGLFLEKRSEVRPDE